MAACEAVAPRNLAAQFQLAGGAGVPVDEEAAPSDTTTCPDTVAGSTSSAATSAETLRKLLCNPSFRAMLEAC